MKRSIENMSFLIKFILNLYDACREIIFFDNETFFDFCDYATIT